MKTRPKSLVLISLFFAAAPLLFLISQLAAHQFDVSALLDVLTMPYAALSLTSVVVAYGIWSVRPWGYFAFMMFSAGGVAASLIQYFRTPNFVSYFFLLTLSSMSAAVFYFLQRHVASPYFNPRERWWETAPRFQSHLKLEVLVDGTPRIADMIDISRTGCFLQVQDELTAGDLVYVKLQHLDIRLEILSKVVRRGTRPPGYGIMFVDLSRADKIELKALLTHIEENRVAPASENEESAQVA